jgi:hypothetical protein
MGTFEFILIPTSIIVGLGIAELLGGVVRTIRGELKAGLLHSIWVWLVFSAQLQFLWASWELHGRGGWTFSDFMLYMIGPVLLYVGPALLYPRGDFGGNLDDFLTDQRRAFFPLAALAFANFAVSDWVVFGNPFGGQDIVRIICIALFGVLAVTRNRKTQWIATAAMFLTLTLFVYLFTPRVG